MAAPNHWGKNAGAIWILPDGADVDERLKRRGSKVTITPGWLEPFQEMWEHRTTTIRLLQLRCEPGQEFLQSATQEWDFMRQDAVTESIAALANVDGAIVVNGSPELLAFGVICNTLATADEVLHVTDPSDLAAGEPVSPSFFGGSRHQSAINFCSDYSPAGAVVASHDGGLTVFVSRERGKVRGARVSLIDSDAEVR